MSDQEQDNVHPKFHREGDAIVIDPPKNPDDAARDARADEQHEFARAQVKTNRRLAWFTGALMVATFCTIGVGIWQGSISQKSADAASSAAATASSTLREMQSNDKATAEFADRRFRIEQRPYLTVGDIKGAAPIFAGDNNVVLGLFNSGRSPALNVRIQVSALIGNKFLVKNASKHSESVVGSDKPAFNSYTVFINANDAPEIAAGKPLTFKFTVTYTDIFQDHHITRICAYYSPKEQNYKYCEAGNSVE